MPRNPRYQWGEKQSERTSGSTPRARQQSAPSEVCTARPAQSAGEDRVIFQLQGNTPNTNSINLPIVLSKLYLLSILTFCPRFHQLPRRDVEISKYNCGFVCFLSSSVRFSLCMWSVDLQVSLHWGAVNFSEEQALSGLRHVPLSLATLLPPPPLVLLQPPIFLRVTVFKMYFFHPFTFNQFPPYT